MSRLRLIPPVAVIYPNDRQLFTAEAAPPPAMWRQVTDSGDIKDDFSLEVDAAGSTVSGEGAHKLFSGIGVVEFTIDDQCLPTSTNEFVVTAVIVDINGDPYIYSLQISATAVEVRDEGNNQIYSESYSTVSGDVYRLELVAGFKLYRNGVALDSRLDLGTTIIYPMFYLAALTEPTVAAPTRIPPPRLIGDWRVDPSLTFTTPEHGSISATGTAGSTEYLNGKTPGTYTLAAQIATANDAGNVQRATATIIIPPLEIIGPTTVTLEPGQKVRFKTNYDKAQTKLVTWTSLGAGSFTEDEFTAPTDAGATAVRATCSVNGQSADIAITIASRITNLNGYLAAKPGEEIDLNSNIPLSTPQFVAVGAVAEGTGAVQPGLPLGLQPNDIMLLFEGTANEPGNAPIGAWDEVADSPQGIGTPGDPAATRLSAFWRRAGTAEASPTITDPGDHVIARILAFRGCPSSGDPWDVTAGDTGGSSTAVSIPGDTTTVDKCLIVQAVSNATDTTAPQTSGYANGDLTTPLGLVDNNTDQGNGGGFAVSMAEKTVAGAFGPTTATLANASAQGRLTIALKPSSVEWSASIGSINAGTGAWTAPSLSGQTAKIKATNGIFTATIEIPVLDAFPLNNPSAPITVEFNKTVLISTAEDRTRTSRVKDKDGRSYRTQEVQFLNSELDELEDVIAFWEEHFPGKQFILEDSLRGDRIICYFDSALRYEAESSCAVNISFRIREA